MKEGSRAVRWEKYDVIIQSVGKQFVTVVARNRLVILIHSTSLRTRANEGSR